MYQVPKRVKFICSFSNVDRGIEYNHICEYVLDFCFENTDCGEHGRCVITLSGFKCSCSLLYDGSRCEKISKQGKQIIIGSILVVILYGLSFKKIRSILKYCCKKLINFWKRNKRKKQTNECSQTKESSKISQLKNIINTIGQHFRTTFKIIKEHRLPKNVDLKRRHKKRDMCRLILVGGLNMSLFALLLLTTTRTYFTSFIRLWGNETAPVEFIINGTIQFVSKCESITNYRLENTIFLPVALVLIFFFSWSFKRERQHLRCSYRLRFIILMEPFRVANRFPTAIIFGILAFQVLRNFEELLSNTGDSSNRGVLNELFERIFLVILTGLRYYPVLASLQLRDTVARLLTCVYMIFYTTYTIIREGSCMGFLSLSKYYSVQEQARIRLELGTWFAIYGLVKTAPHFFLISYITAELCVRFVYDSIYISYRKRQCRYLKSVVLHEESNFAKYYVTKLFRRSVRAKQTNNKIDNSKNRIEPQNKTNQAYIKKFLDWIYHWDDDFRFTTLATCTYTVAFILLYYLACTLTFLYLSRSISLESFIEYLETTLNIEFDKFSSLGTLVIITTAVTVVIFAFQLYRGMKSYKKHKLQLFKGIYTNIPPSAKFESSAIALESIHYPGYLLGNMAWGFIICFHLILFLLIIIQIILLKAPLFVAVLGIIVPIAVAYLLQINTLSLSGYVLYIKKVEKDLRLKDPKIYANFIYFNFLADCFFSVVSYFIRLIKAIVFNIILMARIDYSFLGRPLETYDSGYIAYVSYLHMEVAHTNQIMLAFCYLLYDEILQRRSKYFHDDECKCGLYELDGDMETATKKHISIDTDDAESILMQEIKPKTKSRSSSKISEKDNQKSKQQNLSTDNNSEEEEESGDDDGISMLVSTDVQSIPLKQSRSPSQSPTTTAISMRQDLPFERKRDNHDDADNSDDESIESFGTSTISKTTPQQAPRVPQQQRLKPTAVEGMNHPVESEAEHESRRIVKIMEQQKRKQARFRWFLAYTIINNCRLFFQRKQQIEKQRTLLRIQQSNLTDEQQQVAVAPTTFATTTVQQLDPVERDNLLQLTHSPSQYPGQIMNINENRKDIDNRCATPAASSSNIKKNNQDKSIKETSSQTTSALIHRQDSQKS